MLVTELSDFICRSVELPVFFMKFGVCVFFENITRKFKYNKNLTVTMRNLHADRYTGWIISRSLFLRMKIGSFKRCKEN